VIGKCKFITHLFQTFNWHKTDECTQINKLWKLFLFLQWRSLENRFCARCMIHLKFVVLRRFQSPRWVELSCVLFHEMGVLCTSGPSKVFNLHNLGQHRLVELVLQCGSGIVASENVFLKFANLSLLNITQFGKNGHRLIIRCQYHESGKVNKIQD
jgi:hypothetical protein